LLASLPTVASGSGERARARTRAASDGATASWSSSSDPGLVRVRKRRDASWTGGHAQAAPEPLAPPPTLALGLACAAIVAAAFATGWTVASISVVFTLASAAAALAGGAHLRETGGWVAYLAAPVAAAVSAASALLYLHDGADARVPLVGAAFVAVLANLRWWLDALTDAPVHALEQRIRRAVPATARALRADGAEEVVPIERIRVGDEVVVEEGDVVAVDGVVRKGGGVVLLHPTSRSPVRRDVGAPVLAGARIVEGRLRILATRVGSDRSLLRPLRFADATAADAAPITRAASRLVALTAVIATLGVVGGMLLSAPAGGLGARLAASAAVLVAIPVLSLRRASSTPLAAAGLAAAERGITFASAHTLERAGRVTSAVLCAHGTITEGTPEVVEAHAVGEARAGGLDSVLALAAAVALEDAHPFARALVAHARARSLALPTVRRVTTVTGRGIRATGPDGELVLVGSRQLLLDEATSVAAVEPEVQRAEARGLSVVFVAVDGRARAWIAIRDEVRAGARAAVQRLIDLDINAVVVSGDHRGTVEALARAVDVELVKAELLPEERVAEVRRLREVGGRVAVLGHPARDADVLAAADLPVLLGAAGAPESERGVALASDDLRDASAALWIARAASHDARRASLSAVVAGALLVTVGALGLAAPGVVAILALVVDLYALPTPARVVKRIALRLPVRG
jgi:Cu+-exporting ATPase